MPNIRDVAKACGVSPMTVSYVLNNKRDQVSEETRQRVLHTIRKMRYRPLAVERDGENREILTLGVAAGVNGDSLVAPGYYSSVVRGIFSKADQLRHSLLLFSHHLLHTDTERSIRLYCDGRCDGLLILAPLIGSALVSALRERGLPFVLIGDTGDFEDVSYVDIDNVEEAFVCTERLIKMGHRRIAFLGGPGFVRSAEQRREGYLRALRQYSLPVDPRLDLHHVTREIIHKDNVPQLMALPLQERPTALFAWNDSAAAVAVQALREINIRVPADVSVMGFDDDHIAARLDPPLTTLRQPYLNLGGRAVEILIEQIHATTPTVNREFLATEFVERASIAPPQPL